MKRKTRILVVDDNQDLAGNIQEVLAARGFDVAVAHDAAGAVAFCGREAIDLALLDYQLPDMDGLALSEKLSELTDADFIIITAHASVSSAAAAVQARRIVGYELKPLDVNRLMAFVDQVVGRRRAEQATRKTQARLNTIFNNVRAFIWQKDIDGRYTHVNKAACETLGLSAEDIIGRTDADLFPADIAEQFVKNDRMVLESGKPMIAGEEASLKKEGSRGWHLVDKLPYVEGDRIAGIIGFAMDITERKHAEEALQKALAEKETLLRELHHRTKNNMQVISSMLSIQAGFNQNDEISQICRELENKIQAMALVHEKLYSSTNLLKIDLKDYIYDLMDLLMASYNGAADAVHPRLEIESAPISIDTAIPCGLVLNELVSNAFKHAFADGRKGEIRISLTRNGAGGMELRYADDGPGVPDGFDFRAQKTLGIQTIFLIVERQLGGSVAFEGGGGVSCRICFADKPRRKKK